jgi:hypothetical protein
VLQAGTPPLHLTNPIVITEEEYDAGWQMDEDDEVVFVLPNVGPANTGAGAANLLDTAKLLMAVTPHGI